MNLYVNHKFYFYKTKIRFSIFSNASYYIFIFVEKNLNIYKQIIETNLLIFFKTFYKKSYMTIDCAILYMYEKNGLTK